MMSAEEHPGELLLRRFRLGELSGDEASQLQSHAARCDGCRSRLRDLGAEQQRFEEQISFDRFSAGVARAIRRPHRESRRVADWIYPVMAVAAGLVVMLSIPGSQPNRLKGGGTELTLRIASPSGGPQRAASANAPEPLGPGERVRIGYRSGGLPWVMVISIDAQGEVSALYPETGQSLRAASGESGIEYLPGSLEFTGSGTERVVLVLSEEPLLLEKVTSAAHRAFEASGGKLDRLPELDVPGEQLHRTLLKSGAVR